jgi:hypothetical protein
MCDNGKKFKVTLIRQMREVKRIGKTQFDAAVFGTGIVLPTMNIAGRKQRNAAGSKRSAIAVNNMQTGSLCEQNQFAVRVTVGRTVIYIIVITDSERFVEHRTELGFVEIHGIHLLFVFFYYNRCVVIMQSVVGIIVP